QHAELVLGNERVSVAGCKIVMERLVAALKAAEAEEANSDEQINALIKEKAAYVRALTAARAALYELNGVIHEQTDDLAAARARIAALEDGWEPHAWAQWARVTKKSG